MKNLQSSTCLRTQSAERQKPAKPKPSRSVRRHVSHPVRQVSEFPFRIQPRLYSPQCVRRVCRRLRQRAPRTLRPPAWRPASCAHTMLKGLSKVHLKLCEISDRTKGPPPRTHLSKLAASRFRLERRLVWQRRRGRVEERVVRSEVAALRWKVRLEREREVGRIGVRTVRAGR